MIYTIANIATGLFESIVTFMLFDSYLEKRENLLGWMYSVAVIGLTLLINFSNVWFNFGILNVICIVLFTIIASNIYQGNIKTKVIVSILSVILSAGIEIFIAVLIVSIGGISMEETVHNEKIRLLGIVLSKSIYFIVAEFIRINQTRRKMRLSTGYWMLFFTLLISTGLAMYMIFIFQYYNSIAYLDNLSVIAMVGLMYSFMMTLYLYDRMSYQTQELAKQKLLEQQLDSQIKHVDEIMIAQKQIKKVRHDLKNHMTALAAYFKSKECEEGLEYIDKLIGEVNISGHIIETGNIVIDTILTAKRDLAENKGINFTTNIQIPENLKIASADLCVLLGNILDNAVEACEKADNDKKIDVSMVYEESILICRVINTALKEDNPTLKTTKKNVDEHGIGLSNIKSVLEKYESTLNIERTENQFTLSFAIFA